MSRKIQLRELCHSRTGDKGDSVTLSLIAYDPDHYELIREAVTAESVRTYFGGMMTGRVDRYEMPNIGALNFVLYQALGGGCSKSLRRDIHGKALSGVFLDMEIEVPDDLKRPVYPAQLV
jgi:hypothetical protein